MAPLLDLAKKEIRITDHIVCVTMPMLKDKKLLLSATNHLKNAAHHIMCHFIKKARKPVPKNKGLVKNMFMDNYTGPQEIVEIIRDIEKLSKIKEKEQVSFIKGGDVVILTNNYKTNVIKEEEVKRILSGLKTYMAKVE